MLKTRIIGVLLVKNDWVVQSINFKKFLPIGRLDVAVEFLNQWGIDEIVILDINATAEGRSPNFEMIKSASAFSQTPLSVGGGVSSLSHMEALLRAGADKIIINSGFLKEGSLIQEGAHQFGSQCMIASIDALIRNNKYCVYNKNNKNSELLVNDLAIRAEEFGAGEIFLNSVDRDGNKLGLDLKLGNEIRRNLSIPLILCGGVGKPSHIIDGIQANLGAVAAGNFFHFTEMSVIAAKRFIRQNGLKIRIDSYANYNTANFDRVTERISRHSEDTLEELRFQYIPEEII
jgi:imidazole glycerol-phosphate synthase subunit HisF